MHFISKISTGGLYRIASLHDRAFFVALQILGAGVDSRSIHFTVLDI